MATSRKTQIVRNSQFRPKPLQLKAGYQDFSFSFDESAIFNNPVASGSDVEIESFLFENNYDPSQEVLTKGPFRMFVFDAETQEFLTYSINSILLPDDKNQLPILEFYFLGLVLKANQKIKCYFSSASVPSWEGAEQILQLSVFDVAGMMWNMDISHTWM